MFFLCVRLGNVFVCIQCPWSPDEGAGCSGTGMTAACETLCKCWEWNNGPLDEHPVLLVTELPLQSPNVMTVIILKTLMGETNAFLCPHILLLLPSSIKSPQTLSYLVAESKRLPIPTPKPQCSACLSTLLDWTALVCYLSCLRPDARSEFSPALCSAASGLPCPRCPSLENAPLFFFSHPHLPFHVGPHLFQIFPFISMVPALHFTATVRTNFLFSLLRPKSFQVKEVWSSSVLCARG